MEKQVKELFKNAINTNVPEWQRNYWNKLSNELQVHTKGYLFSKVRDLFRLEHPESKEHCLNTYEPITKGSIQKGVNDIIRIFSNSSFNITASEKTLQLLQEEKFEDDNLFNFLLSNWVSTSVATDPNSLAIVYPNKEISFIESKYVRHLGKDVCLIVSEKESKFKQSFSEGTITEQVFFDTEINTYNSINVVSKSYNERVNRQLLEPVYHLITKEFVAKVRQDGDKFEVFEIQKYSKSLSINPFIKLGGVKLQEGVYESFVHPFVPFGNLALLRHRNHRAVDLMFSYPRMSERETPCDAPGCVDGRVMINDEEGECSVCHGTGYASPQSPYRIYQKRAYESLSNIDPEVARELLRSPMIEYYTPDVGILDYSKGSWKEALQLAEEAIFIQQKQATGNVESAKAKQIDLEDKYTWLQGISKVFYEFVRKVVQIFEEQLNNRSIQVAIEEPISFAMVSEQEAFETLNAIISSEAPVFVKAQQVENFVKKFVSKTSPIIKALRVLKKVDPLLFYANKDVHTFKTASVISSKIWTLHIYSYPVLMQMYEEDINLFDSEDEKIISILKERIEELMPSDSTNARQNILNNAGL